MNQQNILAIIFTSMLVVSSLICILFYILRRKYYPIKERSLQVYPAQIFIITFTFLLLFRGLNRHIVCGYESLILSPTLIIIQGCYGIRMLILYNYQITTKKQLIYKSLIDVDEVNIEVKKTNIKKEEETKSPEKSTNNNEQRKNFTTFKLLCSKMIRKKRYQFILFLIVIILQLTPLIIISIRNKHQLYAASACGKRKAFLFYMLTLQLTQGLINLFASYKISSINDIYFLRIELTSAAFILTFGSLLVGIGVFYTPQGVPLSVIFCFLSSALAIYFTIFLPVICTYTKKLEVNLENQNNSNKLKKLLSSESGRKQFMKHLEKEFSVENLKFCLEYMKFNELKMSRKKELLTCKHIYDMYISDDSDFQVNLPHNIRIRIEQIINKKAIISETLPKIEISIFNDAYKEIQNLMVNDSYSRFCSEQKITKNDTIQRKIRYVLTQH